MKWVIRLLVPILFLFFLLFISKLYFDRQAGFSFGDEWHNFMIAFFMLKGKTIYAQIFHNHQMLMPDISYLIQIALHPNSLYKLVQYHRLFIIGFSFAMSLLIAYRFRFVGISFVLFYESTKYYLFGHLFLPEALVVYPLVYTFGIVWEKLHQKKIGLLDMVLVAIFTWFVLFLREPYAPLALCMFFLIVWGNKNRKIKLTTCLLLFFLSLGIILSVPINSYISQVIEFNLKVTIPNESKSAASDQLLKIFAYPIYLLFEGKWNFFRSVLLGLDAAFLTLFFFLVLKLKRVKIALLIIGILGLGAIRPTLPGHAFFETFHMLPWYGLFIMIIFLLLETTFREKNKKIPYAVSIFLVVLFGYIMVSPQSVIQEKVNIQEEFTVNYAHYYINGQVIKTLSNPGDTLFTDLWDYFIHWQANLDSSYKYSIYTFVMRDISPYAEARFEMFQKYPPDFYYTLCPKGLYASELLPKYRINDYIQLRYKDKLTCLYVNKTKIPTISQEKREQAKKMGFTL